MLAFLTRLTAVSALLASMSFAAAPAQAQDVTRGASGLPVPRFVSLKSDPVNARIGPSREHAIAFVYSQAGLPVEVFAEFDNWRRVRDADGDESWIYHSLLSGRRTAVIAPWRASGGLDGPQAGEAAEPLALRARAEDDARVTAYVAPTVLVDVERCTGRWCLVGGDEPQSYEGWVAQNELFGVYPGEVIE